ncbi:hypothetical protein E8E11_007856 [Didymella keratinophila]|nr:hypothetical protein E8E11_007856 [Didymella keratinophila]
MSLSSRFDRVLHRIIKPVCEPDSDHAHAVWDRKFATKVIELRKGDKPPCIPGRHLGDGGFGSVHETAIGGTLVAVKRTWIRGKIQGRHYAEINILEKINRRRHKHLVQAIGFYSLPGKQNTELGLLIWPVAQFDLSQFLALFETIAHRPSQSQIENQFREIEDEVKLFLGDDYRHADAHTAWDAFGDRANRRLRSVLGCLAKALNYLHNELQIRHKDLKPSQVLLSTDGVWLTDFGWSVDISELSNSATSHGHRITTKYHSPEREARQRCGRSEDIFGLGCIFLEIALVVSGNLRNELFNPRQERAWSFQANLHQKDSWLLGLNNNPVFGRSMNAPQLRQLISGMLAGNPRDRPKISDVLEVLEGMNLFGSCCQRAAASINLSTSDGTSALSRDGPTVRLTLV